MQRDRELLFRYRLCLALGWPHPDYLAALLTREQLQGWARFAEIEPFGGPTSDQYVGMLLHATAQKGNAKELNRDDFVPRWVKQSAAPQMSQDEYRTKAMRKYFGQGGTIER